MSGSAGGMLKASRRKGRHTAMAAAVALALLAGACGSSKAATTAANDQSSPATEGTPVDGGSLVIAVAAETAGWNPHTSEWAQYGSLVASSVLEPLATMGPDNGAKPWLATGWIANDTFDRWQITLRDGVTFQNGEKFDAAAVKLNLEDAMSGPLSGQALGGLFKDVSVVDDHTVVVSLTQPWAAFPSSFLDGQSAMMMAPEMLKKADHGVTHPIGTGPFTFDSWEPNATFRVKKNPTYWQAGLPHLDQVEFKVMPDNSSRTAALEAGDINMMLTTSAVDANSLASEFTVIKDWDTEPAMIMTNTLASIDGKPNPLANEHARKALAYATDRKAVAASVGEGVQSPTSPFSPANPWGRPEDQNGYPDFDLAKAKEEVAAYEQETGASSLSFSLAGIPDVDTAKVLQLVQSQWKDAGIDASIESLESTAFIGKVVKGDYNAALFQIYSSPDPDQNHYFWSADTIKGYGGVNINFTQYTTDQMQADLATGRTSGYPDVRKKAYDDLVTQLNASSTNIWLYWTPFSIVADKTVHGLKTATETPFGNFQPKTWLADLWHE
ncbi:MAG: ABC transporter substrate-binding protein [Acidimicrobiales bacterium]